VVLGTPGTGINAPVTGLSAGDRIELAGLTITGAQLTSPGTVSVATSVGSYLLTDVSFAEGSPRSFTTGRDAVTGDYFAQVACFAAGTRIASVLGEVPVESLQAGDRVLLARGGTAEVVWIGYRKVDAARYPVPRSVWPVRVAAGAFGESSFGEKLPRRDLMRSPDHAVFVEDALIPVKYLIDDETIALVSVDTVTYYHVELPRHDVLLAEGLPVESYLDTGDRSDFANCFGPIRLHPGFSVAAREAFGLAPLIVTGPILDALRTRLAEIGTGHLPSAAEPRRKSG
jgi:hypothetical protein